MSTVTTLYFERCEGVEFSNCRICIDSGTAYVYFDVRARAELETVEHWLKANLNMLPLSMKSLEFREPRLKPFEFLRVGFHMAGIVAQSQILPPRPRRP